MLLDLPLPSLPVPFPPRPVTLCLGPVYHTALFLKLLLIHLCPVPAVTSPEIASLPN